MAAHDPDAPKLSLLARYQCAVLFAFVILLISPIEVLDPLSVGRTWSWTLLCLVFAGLIWIPDLVRGRWPSTQLDWILGAFVAIVVLTALTAANETDTLIGVTALAGQLAVFYAAVTVVRKAPGVAVWVLVVLIAGIALLEIMAFANHAALGLTSRPKDYAVPLGWSGYPELALLALIQASLLIAALIRGPRRTTVIGAGLLLLVVLVELAFLYSRTAWVALIVVLGVAAVLSVQRRGIVRVVMAALLLAVIGTGFALINPTFRFLVAGLVTSEAVRPSGGPELQISPPTSRIVLWKLTARMIRDHAITGVGLGNFRRVFESQYHPEAAGDGRKGVHAHNLWLHHAAELGVVGGAIYLMLWVWVLWIGWRRVRVDPTFVAVGGLLAVVAVTASQAVNNLFFLPGGASGRLHSLTWILFALIAATRPTTPQSPPLPSPR